MSRKRPTVLKTLIIFCFIILRYTDLKFINNTMTLVDCRVTCNKWITCFEQRAFITEKKIHAMFTTFKQKFVGHVPLKYRPTSCGQGTQTSVTQLAGRDMQACCIP